MKEHGWQALVIREPLSWGGIMLIFRLTRIGARVGTCGIGIMMLVTCILWVRNLFGLVMLIILGLGLTGMGWGLSSFWVSELYALLSATTCLNAITSIHELFLLKEANIGGVTRQSDATTMEEVLKIPYWIWATLWLVLAFWATFLGVAIVIETQEFANNEVISKSTEGCPLSTEIEII